MSSHWNPQDERMKGHLTIYGEGNLRQVNLVKRTWEELQMTAKDRMAWHELVEVLFPLGDKRTAQKKKYLNMMHYYIT